jgi:fatty-acyl-CoA synthase
MKGAASRVLEILYGVYAIAAFSAVLLPLWILVSLTRDPKRAGQFVHAGARWMLHAAQVPVQVQGGEILEQLTKSGPWIFAPNHSSYLDVLVTLACLPAGVRFVMKGEVRNMPFVSTLAARSGQLSFDRSDSQARIRQSVEVNEALKNGESIVIYPEGTFTSMAGIRPFQLGAFKSAVDTRRPLCPVSLRGAREILRDETILPRRGKIMVTFGPLLSPDPGAGDDWHEIVRLRDAAREVIARNSGEPLL